MQVMAELAHKLYLLRMSLLRSSVTSMELRLKKSCPSLYSRRIQIDLSFFPSCIMISGRCTKIRWHASGLSMKSILVKTLKIGKISKKMSSTSSRMYLPSSLPRMELFLRTLPSASLLKSRFQKLDASMVSR